MKLIYKLSGLTLVSGVSVLGYLVFPSSKTQSSLELKLSKSSGAWKKELEKEGYSPVDMGDEWEIFPGLLEAFRKTKNNKEGNDKSNLRKLCNDFEDKDNLTSEEFRDAKRWCVKPREVKDILETKGRKFIHKVEDWRATTWNEAKLKELAQKYLQNQEENLKMETGGEDSQKLNLSSVDASGNLDLFKKACENVLAVKSFEDDLEQKIQQASQWCTEI